MQRGSLVHSWMLTRAIALISLAACSTAPTPTKTEAAPAVAAPSEAKPTEAKPIEAKPIEAKPTEATEPETNEARAEKARIAIAALVGTKPTAWKAERWMSSKPLELEAMRGSVLLVRWWTAGCPFCSTTAPTLRKLDKDFASRGLRVIGMYHHKEDTPFEPKVYEETAKKYGFTFPVAFDPEWYTLESWLHDKDGKAVSTGWTSITFLLDKRGVIRHVHPGGSYVEGEPGYDEMRAAIEKLLVE
jgi:peroxiredoxin